ncbi:uncharacterized protein LOC135182167 [Pogoniulus pusillus]|uniref:uncharacterized protein LOC135182167 n=1 Tax=Pogoniulus pusillus TaxID=488313 RepID=UPI0030B93FA5
MWIWYSDVSSVKCPALIFTGKYKGELLSPASRPSNPALQERTERAAENTEQMFTAARKVLLDPQKGGAGEVTKMINKEVINNCHGSNSAPVPKFLLDTEPSSAHYPCGTKGRDTCIACKLHGFLEATGLSAGVPSYAQQKLLSKTGKDVMELKGHFMERSDLPWRAIPGLWFHGLQSHARQLHLGFPFKPISHRALWNRLQCRNPVLFFSYAASSLIAVRYSRHSKTGPISESFCSKNSSCFIANDT